MMHPFILLIHFVDILLNTLDWYTVNKLNNDALIYTVDAFDKYTIYKLDNDTITYIANTLDWYIYCW